MVTNNIANIPTAASGKVLQGAGVGNALTFSTPTYPSASGTARTILVSDGTNNIYSTETWPVPGTSGNVLTSNGTNWTSAAATGPSGLTYVTLNITSAQIKALHGTPIQVVAAPGSGKVLCLISPIYGKFNYGGTNVFVAAGSQTIALYWGTATTNGDVLANAQLTGSTSVYTATTTSTHTGTAFASIENLALNLYNPAAAGEITGNAANNNTFTVSFFYYTVTLT
jgi:hypothetical protein